MSLGIECLITDDESRAFEIALQLDALNRKRQEIEVDMQAEALAMLESSALPAQPSQEHRHEPDLNSLCLFDTRWHQGVIGILASRLKDRFHRPVIVFAPGSEAELKGSGRSIAGFHLRDSLDLISKRHPGLLLKFGGHAAAAGLTIQAHHFEEFRKAFEEVAQTLLTPSDLKRTIPTDGDLDESEINLELAQLLEKGVWGQGFPQPSFNTRFVVQDQRIIGERHLKLKLKKYKASATATEPGKTACSYDAILFGRNVPLPPVIEAVYRIQVNEFSGNLTVQLVIDHYCHPDPS
jgi:single-stranded-DNA-specific exonuclease